MMRALVVGLLALSSLAFAGEASLILHHGKVVTADGKFSIAEAVAVGDGKIIAVGDDDDVFKLSGPGTEIVDLGGRVLLPGLMDSHVHPTGAAMTEFDHVISAMETIQDVLDYITARTKVVPEGSWIHLRQVFITRLKEQRYPTREELDRVAPKHPVHFSTGPDSMLNSLALQLSGIDRNFKVPEGHAGKVELDPDTGEPTGLLRSLAGSVKMKQSVRTPTPQEKDDRVAQLFLDYASVGLTAVCDRDSSPEAIQCYQRLKGRGQLPLRVMVSHGIPSEGLWRSVEHAIEEVAHHPLRQGDDQLRIIGTKTYLDGGMLTGSAYLREPWGVSTIYGISDPAYRGTLKIPHDRLLQMVEKVTAAGLQFTAHSVGDGAVHELLDVYEEVNRKHSVRETRASVTHSNFMSEEDVKRAAALGVTLDIQPVWLYLDSWTLLKQFGQERTRWFQPLKSIFDAGGVAGGGSDHMQKIGSFRSVNPYNPWLGLKTAITRQARFVDGPVHPEQALTREQAVRFYTINNARILFLDRVTGSLEKGKYADMILLDRDVLTCPAEDITETKVLKTWLAGKAVFSR
jgi:predicted amidohydrolase YtcJ